jgi:hypothetical protein
VAGPTPTRGSPRSRRAARRCCPSPTRAPPPAARWAPAAGRLTPGAANAGETRPVRSVSAGPRRPGNRHEQAPVWRKGSHRDEPRAGNAGRAGPASVTQGRRRSTAPRNRSLVGNAPRRAVRLDGDRPDVRRGFDAPSSGSSGS